MQRLVAFAHRYLIADAAPLSAAERLRSTVAGGAGILLATAILAVLPPALVGAADTSRLLGPLGATAVILFTLPHSPLAQPWSVAGGLLLSALAGIVCGLFVPWPALAGAAAVALAIFAMAALRCLHPPGGALALGTALAVPAAAPATVMGTAALNVMAILLAVVAVNNVVPHRRYPQCAPPLPQARRPRPGLKGVEHEDLQHALNAMDTYLDISEEDLIDVYNRAAEHAFGRHVGLRCRDLMTPEPVSVDFATGLNEAWALLRRHGIQSLPVVDRSRRVIGLIGIDDFVRQLEPDPGQRLGDNLRRLLRETRTVNSDKPEVVGQIMRSADSDIVVAGIDDDLAATAASLGRRHQHTVPVVDAGRRLVGVLTQGDVIDGLFRQLALEGARGGRPPG